MRTRPAASDALSLLLALLRGHTSPPALVHGQACRCGVPRSRTPSYRTPRSRTPSPPSHTRSRRRPIRYLAESPFGQQAAVFTGEPEKCAPLLDTLAMSVGRVNINSQCQRGPDTLPFSGRKSSALGTLSVSAVRRLDTRLCAALRASAVTLSCRDSPPSSSRPPPLLSLSLSLSPQALKTVSMEYVVAAKDDKKGKGTMLSLAASDVKCVTSLN